MGTRTEARKFQVFYEEIQEELVIFLDSAGILKIMFCVLLNCILLHVKLNI